MIRTIFFSWQGDTLPLVGRSLVERALERAVDRIGQDTSLEEAVRELTVDKDTEGVAGSPPIVETIFGKIDKAAVFVPDLTFVGMRRDGRPTPNPNVLIEYGWALKSLGHGRMVTVMNTAFGEPTSEAMPFDMRHLRFPITYDCTADADEANRKMVQDDLGIRLEAALRAVLASESYLSTIPRPAEPPPFIRRIPIGSGGRFKGESASIGVVDDHFGGKAKGIKLSPSPLMCLRVMPIVDPGRRWSIDELQAKATQNTLLRPISRGWMGLNFMRSADGFGIYPALKDDVAIAAVMAFNNGEVWGVDAYYLEAMSTPDRNSIPLKESDWTESLAEYAGFLVKLGIDPPFRWVAGMEDLGGRRIFVPVRPGYVSVHNGPRGHCLEEIVVCEGLYSPGESSKKALSSFFKTLYESCGLSRPTFLDDEVAV